MEENGDTSIMDRVLKSSHPEAALLLRFFAFLDPDAIPEELITQGAPELGPLLQPLATDPFLLIRPWQNCSDFR